MLWRDDSSPFLEMMLSLRSEFLSVNQSCFITHRFVIFTVKTALKRGDYLFRVDNLSVNNVY